MKIAVIGMSCRYPGANSAKELFENLIAGRRAFREMPAERWSLEDYYHHDKQKPDMTYCKKAALIEGFAFDPAAFRIPRATYLATDIGQWLALKVAQEALEDAELKHIQTETTGVIIGNTLTGEVSRANSLRYRWPYVKRVVAELLDNLAIAGEDKRLLLNKVEERYKAPFAPVNEDNLAGGLSNTIAGRICNFFDFKGGGFSTDGACSSSLLAINQACIGLAHGNCDLALAGGVDISLDPFEAVGFAKVGALSDSDIRVYDQNSNGFLPGEGCGIVVLQRLEDALAQGSKIYAVVNGIGISSDGKGGITAPSVAGQSLAVSRAYEGGDYGFADVELIEGHGTGTPTGDMVELTTFIDTKSRSNPVATHRCAIGSIKSNIGHTKAAAGVAGFIKTVMSVCYGIMPPTQGIRTPNELFKKSPHLYPLLVGREWTPIGKERRGAVSSAGFGGINTHITLSSDLQVPSRMHPQERERYLSLLASSQASEVFLAGSDTLGGMREFIEQLAAAAKRISMAELTDMAHYCVQHATATHWRLAVVAATPEDLASKLSEVLGYLASVPQDHRVEMMDIQRGIYLRSAIRQPRIAFLFPGQASQSINMGRWLRSRSDRVKQFWRQCDDDLAGELGLDLSSLVFRDTAIASPSEREQWSAQLNNTAITQPAVTVTSLAAAAFLRDLGVRPDIAIGHSLGEYAALCSAGVLTVAQTLQLVAARGKAMASSSTQAGAMLSIGASAGQVRDLIAGINGEIVVSNINSPSQTVVSGEVLAIETAYSLCLDAGWMVTRLAVSSAFHSSLMQAASTAMRVHLDDTKFGRLRHLVIATATGDFVSDQTRFAELLEQQILAPVNFQGAIEAAVREECEVFLEVGPGSVLTGLTKSIIARQDVLVCASDIGDSGQYAEGLNQFVAYMYACGMPLNLQKLFEGRFFRPFSLPFSPNFITSPCEYAVAPLQLGIRQDNAGNSPLDFSVLASEAAVGPLSPASLAVVETAGATTSFAMLRDYIVKEFGYSRDMVTPQAQLRDHLGLDSLKSMEVAHEVMGALGIRSDVSHMQNASLQELADYIDGLKAGGSPSAQNQPEKLDLVLPAWVRTFARKLVPCSLPESQTVFAPGRLLLAYEQQDPLLAALQKQLQSVGIAVEAISSEVISSGAIGAVAAIGLAAGSAETSDLPLPAPVAGCIYLANKPDELGACLSTAKEDSNRRYQRPRALLALAQKLLRAGSQGQRYFALVTEQGGHFGQQAFGTESAITEAGAGFVKSLRLEHPDIQTRCIDLHPALPAEVKARCILDELARGDGHIDAGYSDAQSRFTTEYIPLATVALPPAKRPLQSGDVVLVTGGGKGITAECALTLAQTYKLKLALVGSSHLPADSDTAADELSLNLRRFAKAGIEHRYYVCNVLDAIQVQELVVRVSRDLGPVDAILHAAGVNILHKIASAEWDSFEQVLRPKIEGLVNLLTAVDIDKLKSVMAFSSVIACSGMAGNGDYAYANEWMGQLLRRLQVSYPATVFQAYCFSVWAEVGMGARLNSVELLSRMGIDAVPVAEGTRLLHELALKSWPDNELIISSRMGSLDTIRFAGEELPTLRFVDKVLQWQPGVELVTEVFLDPKIDRYLDDHNYDGSLLFPAVIGIEAMVQCATACRGLNFTELPELLNLQFARAIIVPVQGRAIRIYTQVDESQANGEQRARVAIRSSVTRYEQAYFSCECVWNRAQSKLPMIAPPRNKFLPLNPRHDLYGKILFQGPMFQNITGYRELSSVHCMVDIHLPNDNQLFVRDSAEFAPLFGSGQVRDAFLHAVQLCVPQYRILPVSIERILHLGYRGKKLFLFALEREKSEGEFIYDLEIFDETGKCLELITGFRCRIMADYVDNDNLSLIQAVHKKFAGMDVA